MWPPDGRAAPLTLVRIALMSLLLAATLAACGGGQASVQQVPGPPVALDEPGNPAELGPAATATPTATVSSTSSTSTTQATPTPTATATPSTGSTGSTGTGTQTGSTGNDTQPPPAGSDAQKFEDFCAQNPGAC
jgi:hypothetical protein